MTVIRDRYAALAASEIQQVSLSDVLLGRVVLCEGAQNPLVERMQAGLISLGYNPGAPDGNFGPITRAALEEFQARNGLEEFGFFGAESARALWVDGALPAAPSAGPQDAMVAPSLLDAERAEIAAMWRPAVGPGFAVDPMLAAGVASTLAAAYAMNLRPNLNDCNRFPPTVFVGRPNYGWPSTHRWPSAHPLPAGRTTPVHAQPRLPLPATGHAPVHTAARSPLDRPPEVRARVPARYPVDNTRANLMEGRLRTALASSHDPTRRK
jgi:peptidoglycan hydrolase-like protein with peptidoglycan-binding domain